MVTDTQSPPSSRTSTPSSQSPTSLHLDLSTLPPLVTPSPPSNTLLITHLTDPTVFSPSNLEQIRNLINASTPIHAFSPLKSLQRIIVSFYSIDDAISIRQLVDGEVIMGDRVRVYFGKNTPTEFVDQHLQAPKSQKLFFISPPPSPPFGWEMRNEGPPNKEMHANDLAAELAKLHARPGPRGDLESPAESDEAVEDWIAAEGAVQRMGSATKVVYHPGDSLDGIIPKVTVEDTTTDKESLCIDQDGPKILAHTARPPVELMNET